MKAPVALAFLSLAVLAASSTAQTSPADTALQFPAPEHHRMTGSFDYRYNRFTDTTTATLKVFIGSNNPLSRLAGKPKVGDLTVTYSFTGRKPVSPPAVVMMGMVVEEEKDEHQAANDTTNHNGRSLIVILDDTARRRYETRREDAAIQHDKEADRVADRALINMTRRVHLRQTYAFSLPLREFLRFVNAKKIEGQLGDADVTMPERGFQGLREFASHMNPLTPPDVKD